MLSIGISWRWIAAFVIVAALPMLIVSVPGASDYPNHLARHHVFAAIGQGTALDAYFNVDWRWIGNLGVDLPALALTPLLGVETATRLVSAMIAPLTVVGIILLSCSAHGRVTASAMLALPFAFAQPFLFGFLNYCLSVALALIVAAAWNFNRQHSLWRSLAFGAAAIAVWTTHIMGWAILLILVAGAELATARSGRDVLARAVRAASLLLPVVPLLVWRSSGGRLYWYEPELLSSKVMNFVTALKGLSMPLDLGMTLVIGLAAIFALLWAGGRRLEPRLAVGGGLLLIAALLLPTTVLGSWGADLRLTPVAMMVAIMAIGPAQRPDREKLLFLLGASLFLLRAGWTSAQWWRADRVLQSRLALLDKVPEGSRLGFLSAEAECRSWALTPDRKIGAYAITRRDAFTNTLFQIPGSDLMTIQRPSDSAHWFDGSQDIPTLCPQDTSDVAELRARMARMSRDGFTGLWIAGLDAKAVPALPGYVIAYAGGTDTLLLKARS
ncbi:hypothetical protein [Sphingobium ummariense]|uniref:Glycosyltransferase RgtA/B/C/D-like domain-containing protein n=1 Tax=Sphingobium ummariense RL-3 TaxID=1346791 RepID=T0J9Q1_9SPHN|nr:hypothetical protein [Sphingobium ummariense]EQB33567.1 hypothetical protein M529_03585 [Sphingobium ummariense RL-3]